MIMLTVCVCVSWCRLVLEWNALGMWDEAFSIFCEGLASNTNLSQLDLRNNQINHQGASELSLALKRNSTLQELGETGGEHCTPCLNPSPRPPPSTLCFQEGWVVMVLSGGVLFSTWF